MVFSLLSFLLDISVGIAKCALVNSVFFHTFSFLFCVMEIGHHMFVVFEEVYFGLGVYLARIAVWI